MCSFKLLCTFYTKACTKKHMETCGLVTRGRCRKCNKDDGFVFKLREKQACTSCILTTSNKEDYYVADITPG